MKKKIDWSDKKHKKIIVNQRKNLYRKDTIDLYAKWLKLKHGQKVVDLGCGLGFLGYTYWKYYKNKGQYFGIDSSFNLLFNAKKKSKKWSENNNVNFIVGDAYKIPLKNNFCNIIICQTLLMHLKYPEKVISEMIRVLKPGGIICCIEADNYSFSFVDEYSSVSMRSSEDKGMLMKAYKFLTIGKEKLGLGDSQIGMKMPYLLFKHGLKNIDSRVNDIVKNTFPPYEKSLIIWANKIEKNKKKDNNFLSLIDKEKESFIAGGGTIYQFKKFKNIVNKYYLEKKTEKIKKQIKKNKYFFTRPMPNLILTKGTKPK